MSKITRETMKIFGSSAGLNQLEQFGSLAAGSPVYVSPDSAAIATIQALSNYLEGWFGGVVGSNLPAIQDLNAICYLYAYQLAYLCQSGIAEWDAGTTYYTGSLVNSGGSIFSSLVDSNLNNPLTDTSKWRNYSQPVLIKRYTQNGSFVCPSGVSKINVISISKSPTLRSNFAGATDVYGSNYMWGHNVDGQLGVGDRVSRSSPVAVLEGLTIVRNFGNSDAASINLAVTSNGVLYAWGNNASGALGIGSDPATTPGVSSPVMVVGGFKTWKGVCALANSYALTPSGTLYAWGLNDHGQLGLGDLVPRSTPTAVLGGLTFQDISSNFNGNFAIGLTSGGAAYAWGINSPYGNLGVGDTVERSTPTAVLGGLVFSKVYAADVDPSSIPHAFGLTKDGVLYAWGGNFDGQLGVGDVTPRSSPVLVLGGIVFQSIDTEIASGFVTGLTSDGTAYAWGNNTDGQLGLGDQIHRSSPVLVLGSLKFSKVKGFNGFTLGLTTTGQLYGWGLNTDGVLGVGDILSRSSPVAVLGGLTFSDFASITDLSTNTYVLAVTPSGALYAWGANSQGELGVGDTTKRSSPVAVLGGIVANTTDVVNNYSLSVIAGNTYSVTLGTYQATIGNNNVGKNVQEIIVSYEP